MGLGITSLYPYIGAEIAGIDLSRPIDEHTVGEIWRAIDQYAVVVFHDQHLTDQQLHDFAARFGELEIGRQRCDRDRGGSQFRRSAISRTSTKTTASASATTGSGWT